MTQKMLSIISTSVALVCLATGAGFLQAQTPIPVGTYQEENRSENMDSGSSIANSAVGNSPSGYTGYGMTIPPTFAYGTYCCYGRGDGCGLTGWYQDTLGGITRGYDGRFSYGCGINYGCSGYGYKGCTVQSFYIRRCCRSRCSANSCSPRPNCCGSAACGVAVTRTKSAVTTVNIVSPEVLNDVATVPEGLATLRAKQESGIKSEVTLTQIVKPGV